MGVKNLKFRNSPNGVVEEWSIGGMECWRNGVLEKWSNGVLE